MLSVDTYSMRHLPRRSSKNCDLQFANSDRFKENYSIYCHMLLSYQSVLINIERHYKRVALYFIFLYLSPGELDINNATDERLSSHVMYLLLIDSNFGNANFLYMHSFANIL